MARLQCTWSRNARRGCSPPAYRDEASSMSMQFPVGPWAPYDRCRGHEAPVWPGARGLQCDPLIPRVASGLGDRVPSTPAPRGSAPSPMTPDQVHVAVVLPWFRSSNSTQRSDPSRPGAAARRGRIRALAERGGRSTCSAVLRPVYSCTLAFLIRWEKRLERTASRASYWFAPR